MRVRIPPVPVPFFFFFFFFFDTCLEAIELRILILFFSASTTEFTRLTFRFKSRKEQVFLFLSTIPSPQSRIGARTALKLRGLSLQYSFHLRSDI
jgi:hypothetical protein